MLITERKLLKRFNDAFNRHDVPAMMAMMTEDCVFENTFPSPDGERFAGQADVSKFWTDFFAASPQAHIEVEDLFTAGERGAQCWRYTWVDEQGTEGHVRGVDVFHFRDGKIAAKLSYVKG
jgi:ketosteroid isomerase-like protein